VAIAAFGVVAIVAVTDIVLVVVEKVDGGSGNGIV